MSKKLKISEVVLKDGIPPVISYFENGSLQISDDSVPRCGIFRNKKEKDKYVVAVHTEKALYVGKESNNDIYRTFLAVQEEESNNVKLIEVDTVSLKAMTTSSGKNSEISSQNDLYKKFGSRSMKRKIEQNERMSVKIDGVTDNLKAAASNIEADNALEIIGNLEYQGTYIPCNRVATCVNEVYNLEDIITPKELSELESETLGIFSNTEEVNSQNYSSFFNVNLKEIPEKDRFFHVQILLYAECLVQFLHTFKFGKDIVCPFSEVINKKILDTFTNKRRLTPTLKDKAVCHLIVAGLLACRFVLNIELLPSLIHTPKEMLSKLCRLMGAVPLSKERKNLVVLKIPLPLPERPLMKRKK